MAQHYHHGLVLLSLLVAILASHAALTLAVRLRLATGWATRAWLFGGGFAMGLGIWSMHFVGMLALSLPVPIAYDVPITLLSLLVAIAVSTYALRIASRATVTRRALVMSGVAMGIGICAMHYIGMSAIKMTPAVTYRYGWVVISILIAIAASLAALWIVFTTHAETGWWRYRRMVGAVGMGLAIAGMHYAGMAAAQFPIDATTDPDALLNKGWLVGTVTTITVFVLAATMLLSYVETKAAKRSAQAHASLLEEQETSRAKDVFLAMLGHELRNPLAAIANAIYLLDRAEPSSTHAKFARDVIARQTGHLTRMVDDLLDVGRAVSGKIALDARPLELAGAVRAAVDTLLAAETIQDRRIDCKYSTAWIDGDRTRIEQVVTNLVKNAVQHTRSGGSISVEVRQRGAYVELIVADDGEGMDADTRARAFDLFYQADQALDRGRGGLGIGLTLVRRIVEMHGGSVTAESPGPGKGSTFTIRLPYIAAADPAQEFTPAAVDRSTRRIVLIEDEAYCLLSLRRILEGEGHQVRTATDGDAGLAAIMEWVPNVAIVDIGLPGLNGYQIAQRVRSSGLPTYLVALSGYGQSEDKAKARGAGFDVHLTKPADPELLLDVVSQHHA